MKIEIDTLVSLHNIFPPESKNDIGVVEEIKNDPLGFNYGVREFADDKIYFHHISTIRPFKCVEGTGVNRIEVIDKEGRSYVKYGVEKFELIYQDEGKTLKIFINENNEIFKDGINSS